MKGLNVRKLAAIAVGGALVGSALAPLAAAITLEKSNIVNSSGTPIVNVVVGTNGAAVSDFVWAGNIAAKVAQLATVESDVTGGTGTADPTDLSVDLAVGGEVTYSKDYSYTYYGTSYPLLSMDNDAAMEFRKVVGVGQLPFLTNETKSYRYNGATYDIVVKETVGIEADARFDSDQAVKDLVVYMENSGDFNYVLDLGAGIPGWASVTSATTKFTDGDDDHILIPFLGDEYTIQENDMLASTKKIRLIKESAKTTYSEGDEIKGLTGKGKYASQEMSVKVATLVKSSATGTYTASFELYDSNGNLVHSLPSTEEGTYLNESFVDSSGNYALDTVVYISTIRYAETLNKAAITVITGKDVVTIANEKQYPYDATDTDVTNDYWIATFDVNTSDNTSPAVGTVKKITIKNNVTKWYRTEPKGPKALWSTDDSLSQAGIDAAKAGGNVASFLQGEKEGLLGYNFVKLQFDGFKVDQALTTLKVGGGKVTYTDGARITRSIPFYIKLANTSTQTTFTVDNQTFYYRCSGTDVNLLIYDNNVLNGANVDINTTPHDRCGIAVDDNRGGEGFAFLDVNTATAVDRTADINGVEYEVGGFNFAAGLCGVYLLADGNCEFSKEQFSNVDYLQINGGTSYTTRGLTTGAAGPATSTVYYDDDNTNRRPIDLPLYVTKAAMNDTYRYRMYVERSSASDGAIYLLLDNTTNFTNVFTNADVSFIGTDPTEKGDVGANIAALLPYYWPDIVDFGRTTGDNDYVIAKFGMDINGTRNDLNIYIDTSTDKLVTLPNDQLSYYNVGGDVNFPGAGWSLNVRTDAAQYMQAGWADYGSTIKIVDDKAAVEAVVPEAQIYLSLSVLGKKAVQEVTGGAKAPGVKKGETAVLDSTKVTVEDIHAAAGTCTIADTTSTKVVSVGELVYSDSPEPAGSHIIVGGYLVNRLAEDVTLGSDDTLQEALTGSGDTVVELLGNGDIIVAGYTAADTVDAAKELIDELDRLIA